MTRLTTLDLNPFYRNTIGVDKLFDRLMHQIDNSSTTNYPPYNIIRTGEETYAIQLAVAGFGEGDISVDVVNNNLIISGEKQEEATEVVEFIHQGISARRFQRSFSLADYVEVTNATSKNGILTVSLERRVPEALQPKTIAISYES